VRNLAPIKGRLKKFISYQDKTRPLMAIMYDLELDRYEKLMAKEIDII
jgi:hypothetical protein